MEKLGLYTVAVVVGVPVSIANALAYGFVIVQFNRWFVVPTFGTPEFGYWTAAGLSLLFNLMSGHADLATEVEGAEAAKRLVRIIVRPWLVLGIGAVVHWFAS